MIYFFRNCCSLFICILFFNATTVAQQHPATKKYAGLYCYGNNADIEAVADMLIYPESDSTILFYFTSNSGPPVHNTGSLYGRAKIIGDTASYYTRTVATECSLQFIFSKKKLTVAIPYDKNSCGFAPEVIANRTYKRQIKGVIEEYLDTYGQAINFKTLKPDSYYNNNQ